MRSPFIAIGPAFRQRTLIEPIENVDIFPLLGRLLQIELPRVDGELEATAKALAD